MNASGTLYIVATPIGNLRDITLRALDVLREVQVIAAEDTRQTRKLLSAHDIRCRIVSLHANSPVEKIDGLLARIMNGESVAFVTDAGSPVVSDPGVLLVDRAHEARIPVRVIPGPSAVTAALGVAGLPCRDLRFLGFLPRQRGKQRAVIGEAMRSGSTVVVFESPHRVRALLEELGSLAADRRVALCRELTKIHEEVLRGTPAELLERLPERPRGEFTVIISPGDRSGPAPAPQDELLARARTLRIAGLSTRDIAETLSGEQGLSRTEAYRLVLQSVDDPESSGREDSSTEDPSSSSKSS